MALAQTYGQKDVVCSGPTFKSIAVDGDTLRVDLITPMAAWSAAMASR